MPSWTVVSGPDHAIDPDLQQLHAEARERQHDRSREVVQQRVDIGPEAPAVKADRGGHFAAWEEPDLFATELQAAFRSLR